MKAVIMAGGEGTRLRPLTCNLPKPMARLFDRPVMEYIVRLLSRQGIREIAATLQYMPEIIENYFGDGAEWGVDLRYYRETTPLGTAGSVRQCGELLDEPFLVISGDAVCDFAFSEAVEMHLEKDADVTVVLYRHPSPLDYGLVMTAADGRIERFIEKPSWGQVFTDTVNTGIYVISPRVLRQIPKGKPYDFARDLFPRLLSGGGKLYGCVLDGYWCDIGDCDAFLRCAMDVLDGGAALDLPAREMDDGIWAASPIPKHVTVNPPCYIGRNVALGRGAVIGPYAVLGEGSFVGTGAVVERSVCDGAHIGEYASLFGSILCRNASAGERSGLSEGTVVGPDAVVGAHSVVFEGVRIWPGKKTEEGARVRFNLLPGVRRHFPGVGEEGIVAGETNVDLSPELCISLGTALGGLAGADGRVGLGCGPGDAAHMILRALEAGIRASGAQAVLHDAFFAASATFAAVLNRLPLSAYVEQQEARTLIRLYGADGLPLGRAERRKLEGVLQRGDFQRADAGRIGRTARLTGVQSVYSAAAAATGTAKGLSATVVENNGAGRALSSALSMMGAQVGAFADGVPGFEPSDDGFGLRALDENGRPLDDGHMLAVAAFCAFRSMESVAAAYEAPAVLDVLAAASGRRLLRVGRDGPEASRLYAAQRFMWDGVFRAAFVADYMTREGAALSLLADGVPVFCRRSRELALASDRGAVMRAIADSCGGLERELYEGLRVCVDGGWVHVRPCADRSAVRITVEGANEEIAAELCDAFERRAKKLDLRAEHVRERP